MAYIKILDDINNTSFEPGSMLDIKFLLKGNINSLSSFYTIRMKYNVNGAIKYLDANSYQVTENNTTTEIPSIPSTGYFDKTFTVKFIAPQLDSLHKGELRFNLELIGIDSSEMNGELDVISDEIKLSGTLSTMFRTKVYLTKDRITNLKVLFTKKENVVFGDKIMYTVKATNNAYDKLPVWEDITQYITNGEYATLENTICDSGKFGLQLEVSMTKNNYKSYVKIYEIIIGMM